MHLPELFSPQTWFCLCYRLALPQCTRELTLLQALSAHVKSTSSISFQQLLIRNTNHLTLERSHQEHLFTSFLPLPGHTSFSLLPIGCPDLLQRLWQLEKMILSLLGKGLLWFFPECFLPFAPYSGEKYKALCKL